MPIWLQTLVVLLIVAAAAGVVAWQLLRSLIGRRSRLGACCSRGCPTTPSKTAPPQERIIFVPRDALRRPR